MNQNGTRAGWRKVRSLMKEEGLKAIRPKSVQPQTTDSKGVQAAPNLLGRIKAEECAAQKINIVDITHIGLRGVTFCYLAIWQDKVTRRIIVWGLSQEMKAELFISALQKTISKGLVNASPLVHSDRGSQYGSNGFHNLLQQNCLRQNMSGKGNFYDNAQA